jgi:hypothetical protein
MGSKIYTCGSLTSEETYASSGISNWDPKRHFLKRSQLSSKGKCGSDLHPKSLATAFISGIRAIKNKKYIKLKTAFDSMICILSNKKSVC